jgi:hypothetical protein
MTLKKTLPFLSCFLLAPACADSNRDFGGNEGGAGQDELHGTDPDGDIVCEEDPDATPAAELDIVAVDIEEGSVIATVTFNGDIEAWYASQEEQLPFSLQFWTWNDTYIEAFFKNKDEMKVADSVAEVSHEFSGDKLIITLDGFAVENVKRVRVSTFRYDGLNYSGSCDDEMEIEVG